MKNRIFKWMNLWILSSFTIVSYSYSQQNSSTQNPTQNSTYSGGQAVFVQSPYGSSVYTGYTYDPNKGVGNRLPAYTTNQAVFVQQPYADATQKVTTYPTTGQYALPYTESGYNNPTSYPATTAPAYPFATVHSYTSSPYSTTNQYPNDNHANASDNYSSTQTYPYTTTKQMTPATVQQNPNTYQTSPYNNYPNTVSQPSTSTSTNTYSYPASNAYPNAPSAYQSPYPLTTALPETNIQPQKTNTASPNTH